MMRTKLLILLTIFLLHPGNSRGAEEALVRIKSFTIEGSEVRVWQRGVRSDMTSDVEALLRELPALSRSERFGGRLPAAWSVLIDGIWNRSEAFWSPTLRAPDGTQGIIFTPASLHDQARSRHLLIHELTHDLHYDKRPHEENWVQEGIAMLVEHELTGEYNPSWRQGFVQPETSLTASLSPLTAAPPPERLAQYGHVQQYFHYIYRLCGKTALLDDLIADPSPKAGIGFIDELLARRYAGGGVDPICRDFSTSFVAFEKARFTKNFYSPSGYVALDAPAIPVRPEATADLPRYSARAIQAPPAGCAPGETPIPALSACLQIRQ